MADRPRACKDDVARNQVTWNRAGRIEARSVAFTRNASQPSSTRGPVSPIILSTRVLLTRTVAKPILDRIGHCPTYQGRRKLIETMGRDSVYRFVTGSTPELLDIATLRNRMPSG